uniref:Glycerophosphocholine phosphodiesterase GPCPD1 n=1 Tax=Cacopsylla melanoneura TaxID=428564 RepID=A0A8D8VXM3_9HEMI
MSDKATKPWKFRVKAKTLPGEVLCVTGSCDELGHWMNDQALVLSNESENVWSAVANISSDTDVRYRYFVCISLGDKKLIVRRWESGMNPRTIAAQAPSNVATNKTEEFGEMTPVEKGWLTSETAVQIKLLNPIKIWINRFKDSKINIKVTTVSLTNEALSLETSPDASSTPNNWPLTEISVMNTEEREFKTQNSCGHEYKEDEFVIFQILTDVFDTTAYQVDFFAQVPGSNVSTSTDSPSHIGCCHILPHSLNQGLGSFVLVITDSVTRRPIGELTGEYLVVTPLPLRTDMKISFPSEWRNKWQGLDVGHRGSGVSFGSDNERAHVRENTIASLRAAGEGGADLVEFDVQLSKDLVPIIYHDFYVVLSAQRKNANSSSVEKLALNSSTGDTGACVNGGEDGQELLDVIKVPVKDLTFHEMQDLKLYHVKEGQSKKKTFFLHDSEPDHQPFPTLAHALEVIDPSVGFNIEIKWTMLVGDGSYELNNPLDINTYVDTILGVVLRSARSRIIVFSCFHPDVVSALRLKQNKYPVIFLTQGITKRWPQYKDPRCHNVTMGTHHAISASLLGLSVNTEDLLRDDSQVKFVKDSGLMVWCWGIEGNDPANVKHLKRLGVQAVINDKVVQQSTKHESIFLIEARRAAS